MNESFIAVKSVNISEFEVRVTSTDSMPSMDISAKASVIITRQDTGAVVSISDLGRVGLSDADIRGNPQFEAFRASLREALLAKAKLQFGV